jgi:hypothetical protein
MIYTCGTIRNVGSRPKDTGIMGTRKKLGEILVDLKVLQPSDVDRVLHALDRRFDRQKFGEVARNMGLVSEEHILAALAVQMQLFREIETWTLEQILNRLAASGSSTESPIGQTPTGLRRKP